MLTIKILSQNQHLNYLQKICIFFVSYGLNFQRKTKPKLFINHTKSNFPNIAYVLHGGANCSFIMGGKYKMKFSYILFCTMLSIFTTSQAIAQLCDPYRGSCAQSFIVTESMHLSLFQSYPIYEVNPYIKRAIIVIHGNSRDAQGSFETIFDSAKLEDKLSETILLAPHFKANEWGGGTGCPSSEDCDFVVENELYWSSDGWKEGDHSINSGGKRLSSYEVLDKLIEDLSNPNIFPNLSTIVIAGNSAGGQFVQRFAIGSAIEDQIREQISFEYVVSNPSSYLYLNNTRPSWAGLYPKGGQYVGFGLGYTTISRPTFLNPYDRSTSPYTELSIYNSLKSSLNSSSGKDCQCNGEPPCSYEKYKYGFSFEPLEPMHYMCSNNLEQSCTITSFTTQNMIEQYLSRKVTYLVGQLDNSVNPESKTTNSDLDVSCGGNFQGPDRLSRAIYFYEHLNSIGPHQHRLLVAAGQGHGPNGMFRDSYRGRKTLFGGELPIKEYLAPTYTIRQKYNQRYLDGYVGSGYATMTESKQLASNNLFDPTQKWIITRISSDQYRIQQEKTLRYLDAYTSSSNDYQVMMRQYQNDNTQIWTIRPVAGLANTYTIQQAYNSRFLDAYTSSSNNYTAVTRSAESNDTQKWIIEIAQ